MLERLIKSLESLGEARFRANLAHRLGATSLKLINSEIDRSVDCYGRRMPPRIDDGAAPLQGLRGTFVALSSEAGMKVVALKWYSVVHQAGWVIKPKKATALRFRLPSGRWVSSHEVHIPRRQLVPQSSTGGLGSVWGPVLAKDVGDAVSDHLRIG